MSWEERMEEVLRKQREKQGRGEPKDYLGDLDSDD